MARKKAEPRNDKVSFKDYAALLDAYLNNPEAQKRVQELKEKFARGEVKFCGTFDILKGRR